MIQTLQDYYRRFRQKWREHINENAHANDSSSINTKMTIEEAYNILGLENNATHEEIIDAHRKLMQKLHPDRGGNDYLASKINQAKDLLLKKAA